jgi:hypothetical protein
VREIVLIGTTQVSLIKLCFKLGVAG